MEFWSCSKCGGSVEVWSPNFIRHIGIKNLLCPKCLDKQTKELFARVEEENNRILEYFKEEPKMKVKKLEPKYRLIISQSEGKVIEKALKHGLTTINILSDYEKNIAQSVRADLQLGMDWKKGDKEDGKADV